MKVGMFCNIILRSDGFILVLAQQQLDLKTRVQNPVEVRRFSHYNSS